MSTHTEIAIDGLPASPAMVAALVAVTTSGLDLVARRRRIETDTRIRLLAGTHVALRTQNVADGTTGLMKIAMNWGTASHTRKARAACLIRARHHQVGGYHAAAVAELARAASLRKLEVARRAFAGADAALAECAKPLVA